MLLPQDIVVALKIALAEGQHTYAELANALDMSASQVHSAVERCDAAGFLTKDGMMANPSAILDSRYMELSMRIQLNGCRQRIPPPAK